MNRGRIIEQQFQKGAQIGSEELSKIARRLRGNPLRALCPAPAYLLRQRTRLRIQMPAQILFLLCQRHFQQPFEDFLMSLRQSLADAVDSVCGG